MNSCDNKALHYNKAYFEWQKNLGELGGIADKFKFSKYINTGDTVVDYGCGGGFLLKNISCADKLGIEINPWAREQASKFGLKVFEAIEDVDNEIASVIISNHALEHVTNPFDTIIRLKSKLRNGGLAVFVVPHERKNNFKKNDINQHLYTWSPMNLGNLFCRAGFNVLEVKTIYHKWPPYSFHFLRIFGPKIFHFICYVYGFIRRDIVQVRIVAKKEG